MTLPDFAVSPSLSSARYNAKQASNPQRPIMATPNEVRCTPLGGARAWAGQPGRNVGNCAHAGGADSTDAGQCRCGKEPGIDASDFAGNHRVICGPQRDGSPCRVCDQLG